MGTKLPTKRGLERWHQALSEAARVLRGEALMEAVAKQRPEPLPWGRIAVAMFAVRWAETKNPVYVWKAYQSCREHSIPLPWWVSAYLDMAAKNISSISPSPRKVRGDAARKVYGALRFPVSGSTDQFRQADIREQEIKAASRVSDLRNVPRTGPGMGGVKGACIVVASQMNKSPPTIEKWYYRWKKILEQPLPDGIFETDPPN